MSFVTVVNRSQVTLEILSHANFCRVTQVTRGGRAQVVGRSLFYRRSVGGRSQVYHGGRAVVVVPEPEFMPIDLQRACKGRDLGRKSLLLLGQWLYTFCLLVCQFPHATSLCEFWGDKWQQIDFGSQSRTFLHVFAAYQSRCTTSCYAIVTLAMIRCCYVIVCCGKRTWILNMFKI